MRKSMVLIFFLYLTSNDLIGQDIRYQNALKVITESEELGRYLKECKIDTFKIFVASELIPFNLVAIKESILKLKYLSNYDDLSTHLDSEITIIKKVADSLRVLQKRLNKLSIKKIYDELNRFAESINTNLVGLFSDISDNSLYIEILQYAKKANEAIDSVKLYSGKTLSFFFLFDKNGCVDKWFSGTFNYN